MTERENLRNRGSLSWSRYLSVVSRGQLVRVFHRLQPKPIELPASRWHEFLKSDSNVLGLADALYDRHLLTRSEHEDAEVRLGAARHWNEVTEYPYILYILTARGCNFACTYCPVPGFQAQFGNNLLTPRAAVKGVDAWLRTIKKIGSSAHRPHFIIFYGGEPLLNPAPIHAVLARLSQRKEENQFLPPGLKVVIATNGVLLTEEMLCLCRKEKIIVQYGIDGLSVDENSARLDVTASSTLQGVLSSIKTAAKLGVELGASVTVTPKNLQFVSNATRLLSSLGVTRFGFNMLKGSHLSKMLDATGHDRFFEEAATAILENFDRSGRSESEVFASRKWKAISAGDRFSADCTCYGNQAVLHAEGTIGNCPFNPYSTVLFDGSRSMERATRLDRYDFLSSIEEEDGELPYWIVAYGGGCRCDSASKIENEMNKKVTQTIFDHMIWQCEAIR